MKPSLKNTAGPFKFSAKNNTAETKKPWISTKLKKNTKDFIFTDADIFSPTISQKTPKEPANFSEVSEKESATRVNTTETEFLNVKIKSSISELSLRKKRIQVQGS